MPPRDWRLRVEDILDAIERVERYTSGMDLAAFLGMGDLGMGGMGEWGT